MRLSEYKKKRDFKKTPEPKATMSSRKNKGIFVIQEHKATRLHYDFRIEIDGTLKSWAVPKGLPSKPAEKHLAVATEDHPVEYADFEGNIPKGEYGAGSVKIWDSGKFRNIRDTSLSRSYAAGQIEIYLDGDKAKGNYALINTKFNRNPKNWLIVKMHDDKFEFKE